MAWHGLDDADFKFPGNDNKFLSWFTSDGDYCYGPVDATIAMTVMMTVMMTVTMTKIPSEMEVAPRYNC